MTTATETNYATMEWNELRELAKERGINGRQKREVIEAQLRAMDDLAPDLESVPPGPQPPAPPSHPAPPAASQLAPKRTQVGGFRVVEHTRDALRVISPDGDVMATFYRLGQREGGAVIELDMLTNAEVAAAAWTAHYKGRTPMVGRERVGGR